jgi:rod shape determining protein RodA
MKLDIRLPDQGLILNVVAILAVGLIALASAAHGEFLLRQIIYIVVGAGLMMFIYRICDLGFFQRNVVSIYIFNIALLLALKAFGTTVLGAQRWIKLGPVSIQPSEIAKVCLIITLAVWLSRNPIRNYIDIVKTLAIVAIPALFVVIQPDLGTTLVYIAISFGMIFWAGASLVEIMVLISPVATAILASLGNKIFEYQDGILDFSITIPVVIFWLILIAITTWRYRAWESPLKSFGVTSLLAGNILVMVFKSIAWGLLKDYQQKRLTIFMDPYVDPLGSGYHIIQSLYAIGSGGMWGKGAMRGDLTQGQFVPEQHTDFIFSAIGEEYGFIGSIFVVFLYGLLCLKIIQRASDAESRFASLIAIGTFSMMFFHIFVNIGMTLSVMPITGVPLPFMSYGGSSLLVNLFLVTLIAKGSKEKF